MDREKREKILGWILIVLVAILYFFANLQKVLIPGAVFDTLQQRYNVGAAEITRLGAGCLFGDLPLTKRMSMNDRGLRVFARKGGLRCLLQPKAERADNQNAQTRGKYAPSSSRRTETDFCPLSGSGIQDQLRVNVAHGSE